MKDSRKDSIKRRHLRVRKKVVGTSDRPRLCVYRSLRHLYAQLVDDVGTGQGARTLCSVSTLSKELDGIKKNDCEAAQKVGALIAQKAKEQGIEKVVFDRGGFRYHGRVKSLAEGAREAGLQF